MTILFVFFPFRQVPAGETQTLGRPDRMARRVAGAGVS